MTKIKELAKKYNLFMSEDIPETHKEAFRDFPIGRGVDHLPDISNVMAQMAGCETGVFYECRTQDKGKANELFFIETSYRLFHPGNTDILFIMLPEHKGSKTSYFFHPYYNQLYKYYDLNRDLKREVELSILRPSRINVFTPAKILKHFYYGCELIEALDKLMEETLNVTKNSNNKLIKYCVDMAGFGAKISDWREGRIIETKWFNVRMHINDRGDLVASVDFKGSPDDVLEITKLAFLDD